MHVMHFFYVFFFFNDTATTEIYTLSLHDALPILEDGSWLYLLPSVIDDVDLGVTHVVRGEDHVSNRDRKSTRLNSSHANISYAVFCLKKKKIYKNSV